MRLELYRVKEEVILVALAIGTCFLLFHTCHLLKSFVEFFSGMQNKIARKEACFIQRKMLIECTPYMIEMHSSATTGVLLARRSNAKGK